MSCLFCLILFQILSISISQHVYPYKYLTVSNSLNNPIANNASVIEIKQSRFTVLTDSLIRMEYSPLVTPIFENRQTLTVWNRNLSVPKYTQNIDTKNTLLTIETNSLLLSYNYSNKYNEFGFTNNNLKIQLKSINYNNNKEWRAGDSTYGNLFGTFHTMDTLDGWQNMNCTQHTNWITHSEPEHCIFGLISKNGYFLLDDSQTPILNNDNHWVQPQINGICANNSEIKTLKNYLDINVCFGAGYNPTDQQSCETAGCCWSNESSGGFELIALNLYWNSNAQDNVVSTFKPTENGYSYVRIIGYIFKNNESLPINNIYPIKLWYNAQFTDHFTTTSLADEQNAINNNYTFIAQLGYLLLDSTESNSYYSPNLVLLNLYYSSSRHDHYSDVSCQGCNGLYIDQEIQGYILNNNLSCYKRSGNIDWYFFGNGLNYKSAFKDFTKISDKIPIPRKHMLGISWSKWENLNETILKKQIESSIQYKFGMDTYIFDMNWHIKPQWTGYTWDTNLYPDYMQLLQYIHDDGLYIGANLHDAEGVMSQEMFYPQMATANGIDPNTKETVQFAISSKTYADTLQSIMLQPLVENGAGFDFWWTDWQQGLGGVLDVTGLSPTIWLNHYRFMNYTQINSKYRGLILSRFGGWGNHRYPVGFGGDIDQSWESLQFMIYMDTTASNSLFVYWGQEMMKIGGDTTKNLELFTRVIQFGALSPVYTNYGNGDENDNLWDLSQPYSSAIQSALSLRNRLFPYRYMLSRIAFDEGIGMFRPMYYEYSLLNESYYTFGQYMLGTYLLIAPVCTPIDNKTGYSTTNIWLPPSNSNNDTSMEYWIKSENEYMEFIAGNQWIKHQSDIDDIPIYILQGSIVPMLSENISYIHGIVSQPLNNFEIRFYPYYNQINMRDDIIVESWIYDDDGLSNDYLNDIYSNTTIKWNIYDYYSQNLKECNINISKSFVKESIEFKNNGMYKNQLNYRNYTFITTVVDYDSIQGVQYDGNELSSCSNNNNNVKSCWTSRYIQNHTDNQRIDVYIQKVDLTNNNIHVVDLCF